MVRSAPSFPKPVLRIGVARQYYHARRRPEESPLDYLYRLNVAGLRAKLKIKDGNAKDRREHIETLEDQDLADRLTLLRLSTRTIWKKCYEPVTCEEQTEEGRIRIQ
ncbi:LOW QUALITY PROTEIN: hypothetical protein PHPALM_29669 [Phytophthora palmivora]|uniref:Uncharacterized protein n=1 Tax=Phytophthora palmivora TaxID=4796 RepID=A0A2P4X705_9STRA|nr:LOW QUALITY PROTEIN: hypothetical protein PHPALM_29669 [Phytophthora palmivora]